MLDVLVLDVLVLDVAGFVPSSSWWSTRCGVGLGSERALDLGNGGRRADEPRKSARFLSAAAFADLGIAGLRSVELSKASGSTAGASRRR